MERITFREIIEDIAVHLQQQNFYPNPEMGEGDLLIAVHYGVTDFDESYEELMGYTSLEDLGFPDELGGSGDAGEQEFDTPVETIGSIASITAISNETVRADEGSSYYKAHLLGMEDAFNLHTSPLEQSELDRMLAEGRYFVTLMAYDLSLVKQGEIKLLWSTRYSIRANGQSFDRAILDMNLAAGDYFGKNIEGLTKKRLNDRSRVKLGEIEVIGRAAE